MAAGCARARSPSPGFYHNLHSINHFSISDTPWFADLNLGDKVTYITPRYEFGQAHLDGTALVLGRDLGGDGRQYRALLQEGRADLPRLESQRAEEITAKILIPERYAEPLSQIGTRRAAVAHARSAAIFLK